MLVGQDWDKNLSQRNDISPIGGAISLLRKSLEPDPTVLPPPVSGLLHGLSYALKSAQPTPLRIKCRPPGGVYKFATGRRIATHTVRWTGSEPASVYIAAYLSVESAVTAMAVWKVGRGDIAPCTWQEGLKNYCKATASVR